MIEATIVGAFAPSEVFSVPVNSRARRAFAGKRVSKGFYTWHAGPKDALTAVKGFSIISACGLTRAEGWPNASLTELRRRAMQFGCSSAAELREAEGEESKENTECLRFYVLL